MGDVGHSRVGAPTDGEIWHEAYHCGDGRGAADAAGRAGLFPAGRDFQGWRHASAAEKRQGRENSRAEEGRGKGLQGRGGADSRSEIRSVAKRALTPRLALQGET